MIKNKHIKVENQNGKSVLLSASIIVDYLRNYTDDWGELSTASRLDELNVAFPANSGDHSINLFNSKIGYIVPKITLNSLIANVVFLLRDEKPEYLLMFQSFNNLEKVAIYFILLVNKDLSVGEVFELFLANYDSISKTDLLIKLLSEVKMEETFVDPADPINGLYRLMSMIPTHSAESLPADSFVSTNSDLVFKEFSFPMHSYNLTKRFGVLNVVPNEGVRNYFERFDNTWIANRKIVPEWISSSSSNTNMKVRTHWENILTNSVASTIPGRSTDRYKSIKNYHGLLNQISHEEIRFDIDNEKKLFKYVGECFFDFTPTSPTTEESARAPFTITNNAMYVQNYFNSSNMKFSESVTYDSNFGDFKTALSYYISDLNFWFTKENSSSDNQPSEYLYSNVSDGMLPSNGKVENKGYFSNVLFIQNAIQRVLYPKLMRFAQRNDSLDGLTDGQLSNLFSIDHSVYDTLFDAIINNAYVYTKKSVTNNSIDNNYEIIPNRVELNTKLASDEVRLDRDLVNTKANNLYEFIINSFIAGKNNVLSNGSRRLLNPQDLSSYGRSALIYKGNSINYNMFNTKIFPESNRLSIYGFGPENIVYEFGSYYNPRTDNLIDRIANDFFKMNNDSYSKINRRSMRFFKLPVHSANTDVLSNLNRNISVGYREMLTDLTDLANFNIKGLSLADFTYGEKALLREYIDNFRSIKKLESTMPDYDVVELMKKDLVYLTGWKNSPTSVARFEKHNTYYKISEAANPLPPGATDDWNDDKGYALYINWLDLIASLKNTVYFPEILTIADINIILNLLNRATTNISANRSTLDTSSNSIKQVKSLLRYSAVNVSYKEADSGGNGRITLNTIGSYFLNAMRLIVSTIKDTSEYKDAFDAFNEQLKTGTWLGVNGVSAKLSDLRDVLINDALIDQAITHNDLYVEQGYDLSVLKDLDRGLYKLAITNYFNYIQNTNASATTELASIVFVDNDSNGLIKYYNDVVTLSRFTNHYHRIVPKFVNYLEKEILPKYYNRIEAVRSLPSWDYESFHRRDKEKDLKLSGGVNKYDYNIVWENSLNILPRLIYRSSSASSSRYRVTTRSIYGLGLSNTANGNIFRDRWWRKWLTDGSNAFSTEAVYVFKVPNLVVMDNNVPFPDTWTYNNPDAAGKGTLLNSIRHNTGSYQSGKVATISSFKYAGAAGTSQYYSIGVPMLLLGDNGEEWNRPNTTRTRSFSFETDFFNLWYTDEKYNDGNQHNDGGGEAYTTGYKLVSTANKYKGFGLGRLDIQRMFRHFWNMESTPMGNPYTVMNYDVFDTWDEGYEPDKGDFPWSTDSIDGGWQEWINPKKKVSNKYKFKFLLNNMYKEGVWSPIRLSEVGTQGGVNSNITNDQIYNNFYLKGPKTFSNNTHLNNAILDIYNRNFRNRVYLSYLRWRYYNNKDV